MPFFMMLRDLTTVKIAGWWLAQSMPDTQQTCVGFLFEEIMYDSRVYKYTF